MTFKKYIFGLLAVLLFGVTGFSENQGIFGERKEVVNQAGKALEDMLEALKNNTSLKDHLFVGDLKNTTGCHFFNAVDNVNIRFVDDVSTLPVNSKGVIKGNIEMRKEVLKPGGVSHDPKQFTGY